MSARADLCGGGRSAMIVPTATSSTGDCVWEANETARDAEIARGTETASKVLTVLKLNWRMLVFVFDYWLHNPVLPLLHPKP